MDDVKQPSKAGMMYAINGDTFYSFTKNTLIRDSGTPCHITNNDADMYDNNKINWLIQGSSSIMLTMKKDKLCVNVHQVDGTKGVHTLWPMKFCPKVGVNLLSLMH